MIGENDLCVLPKTFKYRKKAKHSLIFSLDRNVLNFDVSSKYIWLSLFHPVTLRSLKLLTICMLFDAGFTVFLQIINKISQQTIHRERRLQV